MNNAATMMECLARIDMANGGSVDDSTPLIRPAAAIGVIRMRSLATVCADEPDARPALSREQSHEPQSARDPTPALFGAASAYSA